MTRPLFVFCLAVGLVLPAGCGGYKSTRPSASSAASEKGQSQYRNELLQNAIEILQSPERYGDEQKAADQIAERLNQWARLMREAGAEGKEQPESAPDTLIDTLPEPLRKSRFLRGLKSDVYDPVYDVQFLREAVMLRDVVNQVQPDKLDELSVAEALFDWTVRNIPLEAPPREDATPEEQWLALELPWETLFFGRGTPLSRAWVFTLLARQAGLDVVMLATPDAKSPDGMRPWIPALLSGGNLYLFDTTYGLPIPGPKGQGVATLAQAASDDAILRQMDIPGDRIYPKKASDLAKVIALIEASPGYLAGRMKLLESNLVGRNRLVLSTSPATLAEKLHGMKQISEVKLWPLPYEILVARSSLTPPLERAAQLQRIPFSIPAEPESNSTHAQDQRRQHQLLPLRIGRLLQLRGMFGNSDAQRPQTQRGQELSEIVERGAKFYFLQAIPTQEQLTEVAQMQREGREIIPGRMLTKEFVDAYQRMRDDAVFWLGLISFEQGAYQTAAQYFGPMTLEAFPNGPWTSGARYNLARCYEALNRLPEAVKLYEADKSPQRYGNRLRADRLKSKGR